MSNKNSEESKPSFWAWLLHGKGTAEEPWPTKEELLNDKNVEKEINIINEAVSPKK